MPPFIGVAMVPCRRISWSRTTLSLYIFLSTSDITDTSFILLQYHLNMADISMVSTQSQRSAMEEGSQQGDPPSVISLHRIPTTVDSSGTNGDCVSLAFPRTLSESIAMIC